MNDSQVSLVPLSKVLNCQAYILLYSKNPTAQATAMPLSKPIATKLSPSTASFSTIPAPVPAARGADGKAVKLPESVPSSLGTVGAKTTKLNNLGEKDAYKSTILDVGEPVAPSDLPLRTTAALVFDRPKDVVSGDVEEESESDNKGTTVPNRLMLPKRRLILIAPFRFVAHKIISSVSCN